MLQDFANLMLSVKYIEGDTLTPGNDMLKKAESVSKENIQVMMTRVSF